ncbi:MAG: formate dehydrogenase subunit alpha [Alphaproteobacteria bacterium]|nr:formate dehydrogenase subunit alpha [Alphaproteobacteria bacterium]
MSDAIRFKLDGVEVEALPDESIWQVARRVGVEIPHLCHSPEPGYRADGNCRACMVEIAGERTLAASCIRKPRPGMEVTVASERAKSARRMIFELLAADQGERPAAHDPESRFWRWAERVGVSQSRFAARKPAPRDASHPAIAVQLDACIQCGLCARACREVQVNDVIGLAGRGMHTRVAFDFDDPMGASTCVACGECVQACPTGALLPAAVVDAEGRIAKRPQASIDSVCPYCGVGCQVTFKVADNAIIQVDGRDGPANEGRLCVKGRFGFDYVAHSHRLTRPLIRRDGIGKHDVEIDPANPLTHFRVASWDEALDRAAAGFKAILGARGPSALAGFGSAKGSNEEAYLFQKLVRTGFGTNNVDHCTRLCHASSVAALLEGIGSAAVTAPFTAAADAEVIVVIGARPTENHPVAATYFKQAARRGAKLIVMDPRRHALMRHATHALQFRPGTDVALLNALLNVIVGEELYDRQYVAAHTEDFAQLAAHVRDFTPETMAPICGIDAATIREVARVYARSRASIIFWGMGISQHVHGTDNARCLIALALATGQIGRPGTGLHPLRGQNNVQGASDAGLIPMMLPDYQRVAVAGNRRQFEELWGATLDTRPGLTVVEIMHAAKAGTIRGMYIMGENPAMSDPDLGHAREALAALDHLVVQDLFLTETARYADVILPATAWPEKDGTVTNTNRQVQLGRKALEPPGEARPDLWIIQEIARRLGLPWDYPHPRDVFAEMTRAMPSLKGITWTRLERESSVTYPCDDEATPGHDIVFGDRFPTGSGRGRLVPARVLPPGEPVDDAFPMVLTTGRQLEHWHTGEMTRRSRALDALEPGPVASLSPSELARLGLGAGGRIRIETRRGRVECLARADGDVPPGMVFMPFAYREAAANLLTNPQLDPDGKIPEFKYCAARVSAAE